MKTTLVLTLITTSTLAFAQPSVVSLSPLNGSGSTGTYTSVYRHAGGVAKSYLAYLLILPTPNIVNFTAAGSCLIEYNRISNGMRLINDAGNDWIGPIVGVPAGIGGTTLTNSRCSFNSAAVTVNSGADLTITVPVTFFGNMTGVMGTFLQELDVDGNWTGMTQFGNWTANEITTPKPGPYVRDITASFPSNSMVPTLVDTFSGHTSGIGALATVNILVAERILGGTYRCHVIYFQGSREIKLVNDAGTGFVTNSPAQNNTCAIGNFNGDVMFAAGTTAGVQLHVPMMFNPAVAQKLSVWVNAFDNAGNLTHWVGAQ